MTRSNAAIPSQVTFRDFSASESVKQTIEDRIERLNRFQANILRCEVVISLPHKHSHRGLQYHIEIRLHIPGDDIYVTVEPTRTQIDRDIYVAIRDSFDVLERRLEETILKRRGFVKHHAV
ncbi:MAG TPA: HPF/RaiA family ribosome-associated protein [Bdellovibrionales bacterium]|nr:HPF/RaiA family ribosome-associated protein [Bdellovibrionales bacterium]